MTFTAEQKQALAQGEAVPVIVDGARYVLLRADVYENARRVLDDPSEHYPATLAAWDADGSPDDADAYADLSRKP